MVVNGFAITRSDEQTIKTLSKDPEIYSRLLRSVAPSIHGNWEAKRAILLSLLGGNSVRYGPESSLYTRSVINVLLLGDPGFFFSLFFFLVFFFLFLFLFLFFVCLCSFAHKNKK